MPKKLLFAVSLCLCAVSFGSLSVVEGGASPSAPVANASARACSLVGSYRDFPPASYVTSLKVRHTTCRTGKKVIRAYHRCRASHGGANGRCPNRAKRFRCSEGDRQTVPGVQYNAKVTCRRGARRVISTYTQNI